MLEVQALVEEVASIAKGLECGGELWHLLDKFVLSLAHIKDYNNAMDVLPVRKAMESTEKDFRRAKTLIESPNSEQNVKGIEDVALALGRSLGLVLFAAVNLHPSVKEMISSLREELMNSRFDATLSLSSPSPSASPSCSRESGFVTDVESEKEIEEERTSLSIDDVILQLKYGNDEEFKFALLGFSVFIRGEMITDERINEDGLIEILFNRLGSCKPDNRLTIIKVLGDLAEENTEHKEKMADLECLTKLVKSLTRDAKEQREAVGLLLDLSDLPSVWRRLGKIKGCIVLLVSILNGDDPIASHDASKLLNALSSNTQNALHMAEAGYFKPLVLYLKDGSHMSKILMATALSRMELTHQSRISIGEDGAVELLVKMFNTGKLEAKLSALNALQNLSNATENIHRLTSTGFVTSLLQLLFSVTSVLMTLREPASAILEKIAQSESILVNEEVAQQMLSLLNLSSPVVQCHLLQALNSIARHSGASKVRRKMNENGAIQIILPFLTESNAKIRTCSLNLLHTFSMHLPEEVTEQLEESDLKVIVDIAASSICESEKSTAAGILSNIPINDKRATDVLKRSNMLPILTSIMATSTQGSSNFILESCAGILIRFTVPSDKKLQLLVAEHGVIPLLVKLLSSGSLVAQCKAATSLAQLSQNSLSLRKSRKSRWLCATPSVDSFCEVHDGNCSIKSTFCLVKAGAIPPMVQILEGEEREADEAVLNAFVTLLQDEIWENGSNCIAKVSGVQPIIKVLEFGNVKAQEKAVWILERIFRIEELRVEYGEAAQVVLIHLAQNGDPRLKPAIAKLLALLDLLQPQSSYF